MVPTLCELSYRASLKSSSAADKLAYSFEKNLQYVYQNVFHSLFDIIIFIIIIIINILI